jgi:hypothetical protein
MFPKLRSRAVCLLIATCSSALPGVLASGCTSEADAKDSREGRDAATANATSSDELDAASSDSGSASDAATPLPTPRDAAAEPESDAAPTTPDASALDAGTGVPSASDGGTSPEDSLDAAVTDVDSGALQDAGVDPDVSDAAATEQRPSALQRCKASCSAAAAVGIAVFQGR